MVLGLALAAEAALLALRLALTAVGVLHVLPGSLLALPAFVFVYGAVWVALGVRGMWAYRAWRRVRLWHPRRRWAWVTAYAAVTPALAVGLIAAVVYLRMPFSPPEHAPAASADSRPYEVYLVKHSWHTTISARLDDLGWETWPNSAVAGKTWVDIGWGEAAFFQSDVMTVGLTLDALLIPGPAVLHVGAFDSSPGTYFGGQPVVRLGVSREGMRDLSAYLRDSYALGPTGTPVETRAGRYPADSRFVRATGSYYFPNTCNVWTARALRAAGVPVTPELAVTAENLLFQAARLGEVVG